jgi:hypothetical protein
MKEELELKLVEKYPTILKDYRGDCKKTCMAWGMECGDGWYDLLDKVLNKLDYISKTSGTQVVATQIKEKYGTLRFYYDTIVTTDLNLDEAIDEIISDVVSAAERKSESICEMCGKWGELYDNGWWKVRCDEHKTQGQI